MLTISLLTHNLNYERPRSRTEQVFSISSNYLYLRGAQVTVVKDNEVRLEEGNVSWKRIALKVASFVLLFPLTLALLAIGLVLRTRYRFTVIESNKNPSPVSLPEIREIEILPLSQAPVTFSPVTIAAELGSKMPLTLPDDAAMECAQLAPDFFKDVAEATMDPPPEDVSILELLDFYTDLDRQGGIPEKIWDDGTETIKEEFLGKIYENIARLADGNDSVIIHKSDVPYIQKGLLHAVAYLRKLKMESNEKDLKSALLTEIGPSLVHCGDRIVTGLERFYFGVVKPSASYVSTQGFKGKILLYLRSHRREFFQQIVYDCVWPKISDKGQSIHYATTHRYYERLFKGLFSLGGDQLKPSMYENREDLCYKGCEKLIEKRFLQTYTARVVISSFTEMLNSPHKRSDISEKCFSFIKENYSFSEKERDTLLNENGTWKQVVAFLVLKN